MCRFHVPGDSLVVMIGVVAAAAAAVVVVGLVVELVVVLVFLKTVPVLMLEVLLSLTTSTGRALSKGVTRECCDTHTHTHTHTHSYSSCIQRSYYFVFCLVLQGSCDSRIGRGRAGRSGAPDLEVFFGLMYQ